MDLPKVTAEASSTARSTLTYGCDGGDLDTHSGGQE
jgi:hypothetical protein